MTPKQQPKPSESSHDRRAAALRENLRKRKQQAELREAETKKKE